MPNIQCKLSNERPFRLVPSPIGRHCFGGVTTIRGMSPASCSVPCQLVLLLDLTDVDVPVTTTPGVLSLPLVYPFKYGGGGPSIQYAIKAEDEIAILYISDEEADAPEWQYLQVDALPRMQLDLVPLTYEEARYLTFRREDGYFQASDDDKLVSRRLYEHDLILLGGRRNHIDNAGTILCRNPECRRFGKWTPFKLLTMIPPIKVRGDDEFWYEFQGGHVDFCFGFCPDCGTIIAFNVAG